VTYSEFDTLTIKGGTKLYGNVKVSGAKNAALPIMAASLLPSEGRTKLANLPIVDDVLILKAAMEKLGVHIHFSEDSALIDTDIINNHVMPLDDSKKMRASVLVAGPLLASVGEAIIAEPGGCVIGNRPIDLHLMGFQTLGAKVERMNKEYLKIKADKLKGNTINLPSASVGATENLMMAACLAEGKTIINNAAREPEIVDLANFLTNMGAGILGAGTSIIKIEGVKKLEATEHKTMPDRIEAGTFIMAGAITGGEVQVKDVIPEHIANVIEVLKKVGVSISVELDQNTIVAMGMKKHKAIDVVTASYPGFPTDLQPLLTSLLSLSEGVSMITDTIFPKRFCYVNELRKMGADIMVAGNSAIVKGVKKLHGTEVSATDLRGGAALILSGLAADCATTVNNVYHVDRGYEKIEEKLRNLGARVTRSSCC
jgi:UDP-N-acetylglucosamine 1-carboxyvinyltransferase